MNTQHAALLTGLALAAHVPATALACGGFFCSQEPMDQSKERIVFGIDKASDTVEAHVQIFYQGSAEEFAWVVPVPKVPEVGLSSDELFAQLEWRTAPQFFLDYKEEGDCEYDDFGMYPGSRGFEESDADVPTTAGSENVVVVDQAQVGPYDQVTLQATSSDALLAWLNDNDYVIPPDVTGALGPYIADGAYVIALKLQSDKDSGDIAPVKFSYQGDAASIPLILTSIAATPDMRLQPYILSDSRAVPQGYLHVKINEAAIDWFSFGANYDDVITKAADEAGGHAFATDFAGATTQMQNLLGSPERFDLDALRRTTTPSQYVSSMLSQGMPRNTAVQNIIRAYIPMPQAAIDDGVDESFFYNCLECHEAYLVDIDFDPEAMTDALDELIVTPLLEANALFTQHAYITRMTSSMSPEEMTEDPIFVLNDTMPDVSNQHQATFVLECGDGLKTSEAPGRIELQDGRQILVPPMTWMEANDYAYSDIAVGLGTVNAEYIESTSGADEPMLIADHSGTVASAIEQHNAWVRNALGLDDPNDPGDPSSPNTPSGCGCSATGGTPSLWALGLAGLALLRRRRS